MRAFKISKRGSNRVGSSSCARAWAYRTERLPLLWDMDFIPGEPSPDGTPRYVLCEINVSSVSPFPPSCDRAAGRGGPAARRRPRLTFITVISMRGLFAGCQVRGSERGRSQWHGQGPW